MTEAAPDSLTLRIARFAARLTLEDIPDEVREKAKLHILDTVGCGIAGASSDLARRLIDFVATEHGAGTIPVLGSARSFGPAAAAFANAAAMNALDFDDGFEIDGKGMGHPGATIVAAALSACRPRTTGGDLLRGVIAGYEVNNRLILAMQPSHERFREVYGVCQHQTIGAAVAHGVTLGLDSARVENAIGFAATLASVPSLRKYNWQSRPLVDFKDFNAPAAEAGVRAVQLDALGLAGARDVLDGASGYWRMAGSDRFDPAALTDGLGADWLILRSSIKPYPACRWMHAAMEAFETLTRRHALQPREIERVVVHTSAGLARDFMDHAPATMVDAQFSLPFCLAALALGVSPASRWYENRTLRRNDMLAFARKVAAEIDDEVDAAMSGPRRRPAGRVSILARGERFGSSLIAHPRGGFERPVSSAEIREKFMANAAPVLGQTATHGLVAAIGRLERTARASAVFAVDPKP